MACRKESGPAEPFKELNNASFITIIQAGVLVDRDGLGSGNHRAAGVMQGIQHAGSHS